MRIEGKGSRETVQRLVDCINEEFAFVNSELRSEDGTEVYIDVDSDDMDFRIFEAATFINMDIRIFGNGWNLKKEVGKGLCYEVK